MQFVVLSSSRGTTFQAVLYAMKEGRLQAQCLGLVTDRADRGCTAKAKAAGLPVAVVEKKAGELRESYDRRLDKAIHLLVSSSDSSDSSASSASSVSSVSSSPLIACMGFMSILSPWFVAAWKNRILNVHPALLPKYGGRGMYGDRVHEAVLASGDTESGMTIHLMDEGVDTGRVLLQKICPVLPGDTVSTLKARVQALEGEWYPTFLQMVHTGEVNMNEV